MIKETLVIKKLNKLFSKIFEDALIEEIIKVGHFDKTKKGDFLLDIGDELTHIPLILEGNVKIIRQDKDGYELALYFLEPGDTCAVSFINCINMKKSIFRGTVEKDVEAIFLPIEYIEEWLIRYKSWRHFIIDSYHFRLLEMVESIDNLAFFKMRERILKYLTHKTEINNTCDLEITHLEIAHDLHTSRVVISRIIKQLNDENIIHSSRSKIHMLVPIK